MHNLVLMSSSHHAYKNEELIFIFKWKRYTNYDLHKHTWPTWKWHL